MFKAQQKHNLTHQLTHSLGISIVKGEYSVGEGLPSEADICVAYDVSRSATREAVKMLSAKGLISSRPKQGIRVMPEHSWNMFDTDVLTWILNSRPSINLLKEFTQVRFAIEPKAAALAAQQATEEQLEEIAIAVQRMHDAEDGLDDPLDATIAFHTSILLASGNRFFSQLTDFISTALRVSIRYTNRNSHAHNSVERYSKILDSISNGKVDASANALTKMLNEALANIDAQLASNNK